MDDRLMVERLKQTTGMLSTCVTRARYWGATSFYLPLLQVNAVSTVNYTKQSGYFYPVYTPEIRGQYIIELYKTRTATHYATESVRLEFYSCTRTKPPSYFCLYFKCHCYINTPWMTYVLIPQATPGMYPLLTNGLIYFSILADGDWPNISYITQMMSPKVIIVFVILRHIRKKKTNLALNVPCPHH